VHGAGELRFEELATPLQGWPPSVLGKGEGIGFTGGAPLAVYGPMVEGYARRLGTGVYGQPGFDCPGTLK